MASQEPKSGTGLTANQWSSKTMRKWPSAPPLAGNLNVNHSGRARSGNVARFYAVVWAKFYAAPTKTKQRNSERHLKVAPFHESQQIRSYYILLLCVNCINLFNPCNLGVVKSKGVVSCTPTSYNCADICFQTVCECIQLHFLVQFDVSVSDNPSLELVVEINIKI